MIEHFCASCGWAGCEPRWVLPNKLMMTMDVNVVRRSMEPRCPRCESPVVPVVVDHIFPPHADPATLRVREERERMASTPTSTRPRVFIVQEGVHDYSQAMKYGEIDFLMTDEISVAPVGISPRNSAILQGLCAKLTSYVPGIDFVLLTGSPIAIVWTAFALRHRFGSLVEHRFLKWDAQQRDYIPFVVSARALYRGADGG